MEAGALPATQSGFVSRHLLDRVRNLRQLQLTMRTTTLADCRAPGRILSRPAPSGRSCSAPPAAWGLTL